MRGLILQPGSFNPLHRMHIAIAEEAIKQFPKHFHAFILSSETCDKGIIPQEKLVKRKQQIKKEGFRAFQTKSGLFIDHINHLRRSESSIINQTEPLEIIFAVGEDTLYRFFRDWDKFYNENHPNQYLQRYKDYKIHFENVLWYVSKRICKEREEFKDTVERYFTEYDNIKWSSLDLDDISSTKIRNGEM